MAKLRLEQPPLLRKGTGGMKCVRVLITMDVEPVKQDPKWTGPEDAETSERLTCAEHGLTAVGATVKDVCDAVFALPAQPATEWTEHNDVEA